MKVLTIKGYESDFVEYLVAYYLFEITNNKFKDALQGRIYRDDGLLVFKGKNIFSDIRIWRDKFQEKVD